METTVTARELVECVAQNIRERRTELKMSQTELAKAAGVRQPAIAYFEAAKNTPRLETIAAIAAALHCAPDILLRPRIFSRMSA